MRKELLAERDAGRRFTDDRPYFLFVGSLHPRKNLKGLLEAFRLYRTRGGEHELLIVGAGMWTANETQADGVHYAGRLGREELAEVMRGAEGLVFVPWFEGFGVPIVEAFSLREFLSSRATQRRCPKSVAVRLRHLVDPCECSKKSPRR